MYISKSCAVFHNISMKCSFLIKKVVDGLSKSNTVVGKKYIFRFFPAVWLQYLLKTVLKMGATRVGICSAFIFIFPYYNTLLRIFVCCCQTCITRNILKVYTYVSAEACAAFDAMRTLT